MKILITQETDWLKRNPAQQHHLAEMLSLRGHQVRAIDHEILWKEQPWKGPFSRRQVFERVIKIHADSQVTVIRPGIVKVPWLDYVSLYLSHRREISRQIKEFSPDVIVGFGIMNSLSAATAAKKAGIPFVYYWIDVLHMLMPSRIFESIARKIEIAALKRADRVLAINEKLGDYVKAMGAPADRTLILPAGIDTAQFDPARSGEPVRTQYGFRKDDIVLFFMGWLYEFSGLKEVAHQLAVSAPNIKLLVVGEGDAYDELLSIRHESRLETRLILTGKKNYRDLPEFIAAADVCILPAYPAEKIMQDIVPIKTYEYMAMAKPVVSTRLPGVMKEFGEGNGMVYTNTPEEVIAAAVEIVGSGKKAEMSAKAREFALRNSWDNITDKFEVILKQAIEEKKSKSG